jgi:Zn-dependent M28 family amino/carboxypeptidase
MAAGNTKRDAYFVALSGHELGLLGIDAYIERRPDLVKRAHVWIFYGSDIGAPRQPNLIHASDDALERWLLRAMEREALSVNVKLRQDAPARGEAGPFSEGEGGS